MLRPRIIPCLLVHQGGLVKTINFSAPKYVGDPINAVKIFNEKEADELIVLDIDATANGIEPNYSMIARLADECRMPLCYGGGIKTLEQAKRIVNLGVEKVALSSVALEDPRIVSCIADALGRQSLVVVLDIRKKRGLFSGGYELCTFNATKVHKYDPFEFALRMQELGAGELIINSIDNDGYMNGYDLDIARKFRMSLKIPLTFLGGCGSHSDIEELLEKCGVVGAAAGSLFVFKGSYRAVLINYPTREQKDHICYSGLLGYSARS